MPGMHVQGLKLFKKPLACDEGCAFRELDSPARVSYSTGTLGICEAASCDD